jgi:superkiller protein 3
LINRGSQIGSFVRSALVLTPLLAWAQTTSPSDYQNALADAEKLLASGDQDGVIRLLSPWVTKNPKLVEAHHGLGIAYYQKPDFPNAIRHLSIAFRQEPENSPAWRQTVEILAMAYYFSNRAKDALPLLEMASSWSQDNTNFQYTLAMAYLSTHDRDNARRSFARIFGLEPESAAAYILAADLMSQEKYVDDSEAMILAALKKRPDLPLVSYKLGLIALTRGRFEEAAKHMINELATNPGHSNAWHYLGDAYIRMGKINEAVEPLQRAIWLNLMSTRSYLLLANVYVQQERFFVAENTLKRVIDMEPRNYEAHFQLARIYHRTSRPELAKKEMEIANGLRPALQQ